MLKKILFLTVAGVLLLAGCADTPEKSTTASAPGVARDTSAASPNTVNPEPVTPPPPLPQTPPTLPKDLPPDNKDMPPGPVNPGG
jgi:hypothetical protein